MASFSDSISQFNPYIQQLPVDAMTSVGMYKQQKYDEGIQKVQSYIDNVAGLDVVRDIDKAYLQSKLNELGSKLKTVAAGDFSNYQLVNSVGGMATQIVKDPNVQNAVTSTSWYRKQLADMEAAIKEGKSSQANIYDFNEKSNSWLNSTELGKSFKDRYTPYKNVKAVAMEAIKALHPKLREIDIPYKIEGGVINTKEIADAMQRNKIEGIDENQIKQAISASLTPDDINQLEIDANYQFRGIDSDNLVQIAQNNYKKKREDVIQTLDYLRGQLNLASADPNESKKIQTMIAEYEKQIGKDGVKGLLDEQLEDEITNAKENPRAVKLSIYKDGFIKEFANAFSWKNQSMQYVESPLRKQKNWVAEMKHKQEVENRLRFQFEQEILRKDEANRIAAEANALKKAELYGDPSATTWTTLGDPTTNKLKAQEFLNDHLQTVEKDVDRDLETLRTRYTNAQINEMLDDLKKNPNSPKKVPADALTLVQKLARNKNYLNSLEEKEKTLRADAERIVTEKKLKDPQYQADIKERDRSLKLLNEGRPIPIYLSRYMEGGRGKMERVVINKTPSEIVNDVKSGIAEFDYDRGVGGEVRVKYTINGKVYKTVVDKSALAAQGEEGASEMRKPFVELASHLDKFKDIETSFKREVDKEYTSALAPLVTTLVPEIKAIARTKEGKIPPVMFDRVSALITASQELDIAADENYSASKAEDMLKDENIKDTKIFIYRKGDGYEVQLKNPSVDKNVQRLRLNAGDISRYFGPEYVSDKTQESIRLELGKGNTNLTSNPERAVLQKTFGDFPGVTTFDVIGDMNRDLDNRDLYIPSIGIRRNDGGYQIFQIAGPDKKRRVGYDQGIRQMNSLTDESLFRLLKENYPNFDYSVFNR